ncbi:protein kinase C-binding protein NELL2a-like [Tubulanus polymorphus]|uniref:protein kinase C-binding protein NELL2a-like n=1 Tax=Tubulanus polymorphus TaxID=672921 RepID=UPI003DA247CE
MQFTIWIFRLVCFSMLPMIEVLCLPRIERKYVIDLLASLKINHTVMESVRGYSDSPAYQFKGTHREIQMPKTTLTEVLNVIEENKEFTFLATIKQRKKNSGVIFSISKGRKRYLELQSSGRRNELRLHFWDSKRVIVETFRYKLDDQHWHRLALSISGGHLTVYIDCMRIYERVIHPIDVNFKRKKGLTLWLGQRNQYNYYYQGILQDIKLVARPYGFSEQCPDLDSQCPTCGQFHALESKFDQLAKYVQVLEANLKSLEEKVNSREQCECMKACVVNNTRYRDGESWTNKCDKCTCRGGNIECTLDCPKPKCQYPVKMAGQCCPVCHPKCFHERRYFEHGRGVMKLINRDNVKSCLNCTCKAGSMNCQEVSMDEICPVLNCSRSNRYREPDECCEKCMGTDFCSEGNDCHVNASCNNLDTMYQCKCKQGFKGDGRHCEDEDECSVVGSHHAHHCQTNTQCINTVGSYSCQCLSGFYQVDALSCEDLDECQSGQHTCESDTICVNTEGSYTCHCKRGYVKRGNKCQAICHEECQNGGKCVEPNVCHCRHGFKGKLCEIDIDECKLGISSCYPNSQCVNLPGSYYCRCKLGYRSKKDDNKYGRLCRDINECETSQDTCHFSSLCNNTDGSYECLCNPQSTSCQSSCIYHHKEYSNGTIFENPQTSCEICQCLDGLVSCDKIQCDCSKPVSVNSICCPHCSATICTDNTTVYTNGQRWHNYQCEICECLGGEIDCWDISCPELSCDKTIHRAGECCPRCADDNPCSLKTPIRKRRRICRSQGRRYREGQRWRLDSKSTDDCTVCQCKGGHTCCSYMPKYCRRTSSSSTSSTSSSTNKPLKTTSTTTAHDRQTRSTNSLAAQPAVTPSIGGDIINPEGDRLTNLVQNIAAKQDVEGRNIERINASLKTTSVDDNSESRTVTFSTTIHDDNTETSTSNTESHSYVEDTDISEPTTQRPSESSESSVTESNIDSITQTTLNVSPRGESITVIRSDSDLAIRGESDTVIHEDLDSPNQGESEVVIDRESDPGMREKSDGDGVKKRLDTVNTGTVSDGSGDSREVPHSRGAEVTPRPTDYSVELRSRNSRYRRSFSKSIQLLSSQRERDENSAKNQRKP